MAIELIDDGTLDTVLHCSECGEEMRYNYDPTGPNEVDDAENQQPQSDEQQAEAAYEAFVEWAIEDATADHECASDAELPYCANCDAPFSPNESGYDTVCSAECATAHEQRTGGLDQ